MSHKINQYIIYYLKAILKNQGKINFSNIAQELSHDGLTRTLSRKYQWQRLYWDFLSSFVDLKGAYLIIDDTILEKPFSKTGNLVRYLYSHKESKAVKGIGVVLLLLVAGNLRIPLDFRVYDKSKTKIELALELLSFVRNDLGFKKMKILFDSWYPAKRILKRISDYGWQFICRIKRNRTVNGTQVRQIFNSPYGMTKGKLAELKVILVRHGKYYLVTNSLSLTKEEIRDWYGKRGQIEEVFKLLKSYFKAKDCQSRSKEAWKNHLFLSHLSFCFVEKKRVEFQQTVYKTKLTLRLKDFNPLIKRWTRILAGA